MSPTISTFTLYLIVGKLMHTFVCNMIYYKLSNVARHAVSNDWIYIVAIPTPTVGAYNTFATSYLKLSISTKCTCLHECELHNWYIGYSGVHCFVSSAQWCCKYLSKWLMHTCCTNWLIQ